MFEWVGGRRILHFTRNSQTLLSLSSCECKYKLERVHFTRKIEIEIESTAKEITVPNQPPRD